MPSSFLGLNIARSGMSTYNTWLNTTAHNVANVKTEGYSRQTVKQSASTPISMRTSYGMVGTGAEAYDIVSERDVYYDSKYRMNNTSYGKYEVLSYYMKSIEDSFYAKDIESGGMTNSLDNFFKSISSLTTDVPNTTIRTQAIGFADTLTQYIQEAAYNLQTLQMDVNDQIAKTVDQINAYAEQIVSLNKQINSIEVYGTQANDLRDQRAYVIDQLSELVGVEVVEKVPADGNGYRQYIVSVGSAILVDSYSANTIQYEARKTYNTQTDIDNLYALRWSNGQSFGIHEAIGGKLQALFELRDGNNDEIFEGKITGGTKGDDKLVVTGTSDLASSIFKLDIPATDGIIRIDSQRYEYESFKAEVAADGTYTYTFTLKSALGADVDGKTAGVGEKVDFRGIPYYMSQLNEFVRKFSYEFNKVQTAGYDLSGNQGKQMFVGTDKLSGKQMEFETMDFENGFEFESAKATPSGDKVISSYFSLTAFNTVIDADFLKDSKLLACSDEAGGGASNGENLAAMLDLQEDKTMFRQGQPGSFLQVLTSTAGVDAQKVQTAEENAKNITDAVDNRRLSKAGVDEDEEGQNLIICQNLLSYQYKVLSIMNEVLDKLINDTAV